MNGDEAMLGPFEPRVPCRNMETRPCVEKPPILGYLDEECPAGECSRHPDRDIYEPMPPPTFTCPVDGTPSQHPDDVRFGYCWTCHDFTGEPTNFVTHDDARFGERVRDKVRHMPPRPVVMTDEVREKVWADNLAVIRAEETHLLRPGTALFGSFGHGAVLYEPDPTRWQRLRNRLRGQPARGGEVPTPREFRPDERLALTIGLSPGARRLGSDHAIRGLARHHVETYSPTWRERARWRLRDARDWALDHLSALR